MGTRPDQHLRVEAGPPLTEEQSAATAWADEAVKTDCQCCGPSQFSDSQKPA